MIALSLWPQKGPPVPQTESSAINFSTSSRADAAIAERRMLDHKFYRDWMAGALTQETLTDYAEQYFHHVEAFPRAVSMTHALCESRNGRRMLAENLAEEEGVEEGKTDHPELWMQFAEGMGATRSGVKEAALYPETTGLIDAFRRLSRRSYAAGLGALYAYESQIPDVARSKIDGLRANYGVTDDRTLKFFTVHEVADEVHAEVCRQLLDELDGENAEDAVAAARELSESLLGFLDGVERARVA
ncbi:MAG: CADD family putative folate metabolism protein [Alphaproteobacteria bacterium]|nr:CADD family putative folate metabolism protein [Alphaproteobacteria bacterium]